MNGRQSHFRGLGQRSKFLAYRRSVFGLDMDGMGSRVSSRLLGKKILVCHCVGKTDG